MQINTTGSADLQRSIRLLCREYIDILSPTVREEPARVPPLSMKVDSDKWRDKRNRLSPLPMGLKGAASYFQRMMTSEVLTRLLYIFVELYLDDVLVYATNDDEFLE
jgi:hypothetical protein